MPQLNNGLEFIDFSHALEVAPRQHRLVTAMNLFEKKYGTSTVAEVLKISTEDGDILGSRRGGDRNFQGSENVITKFFRIPYFTLDRPVGPSDLQDFVSYMNPNAPKSAEEVVRRNLTAMTSKWQNKWEKAQIQAIMGTGGDASVETYNYYTVYGQTKISKAVDFASVTVDPMTPIEMEGRQKIIALAGDNAQSYGLMVLCSSTWFQSMIDNAFIAEAYKFYASTQEVLRQRLAGDSINRVFQHKGILFIEDISGNIPAGKAYMFPKGIEGMFTMHFAPAHTVDLANTVAKESYLFIERTPRSINVETESSFLCVNNRPELVIEFTIA